MASIIRRMLKQTVTYWSYSSYDKYGDPSFAAPTTFVARFESKNVVFTDKNGEQAHSKAIVYSTTAVAVDGYLFLGTSTTTNPESVSGADRIRRVDIDPNIKGTGALYKAYL